MSHKNNESGQSINVMHTNDRTGLEGSSRKRFERKPNFDMQASLSKDGKYWIIKRLETWILPRRYLEVISENFKPQNNNSQPQKQLPLELATNSKKNSRKGKRNADGNG